jgi:hypothetical protein
MTREEKILLAIEKGITCDPVSGKVYGVRGKEILRKTDKGYIRIGIKKDCIRYELKAHQFVYYISTGRIVEQIDHINGFRDDNRIENLREVTNQQNCFNKKETKGYYFEKDRDKWLSQITIDGKRIHLGRFKTEQEARQAYLDAKEIYHII